MHIKFDSLNQHEPLVISMCNPGSKYDENAGYPTRIIGVLSGLSDEELLLNFNTTSELNFRVYKNKGRPDSDLSNDEEIKESVALFDKIQNRRLLFAKDIGYFVVEDVVYGYDDSGEYKDVKSPSVESELRGKKVPYIEDNTYGFVELLSKIVLVTDKDDAANSSVWRVYREDIPSVLEAKHRTFEDVDVEGDRLSFLTENMQEAYECIFEFDIVNRIVRVFDQSDYVKPTDIHLTKNDLINSISVTENSDNLYTALSVLGADDETISSINPLGGNVIYDFSYYLPWMSEGLREKVIRWQKAVADNEDAYYEASLNYFKEADIVADYDLEISRLNDLKQTYEKCMISKTNPWLKQLNEELIKVGNALCNGFTSLSEKVGGSLFRNYKNDSGNGYDCKDSGRWLDGIKESYQNPGNKSEIVAKAADFLVDGLILVGADLFSDADVTSLEFEAGIKRNKVVKDIETSEAERTPHKTKMDEYNARMKEISNSLNMQTFFGADFEELNFFVFEGNYKDDYVVITDQMSQEEKHEQLKTMLGRARLTLSKASYPMQEFSVDMENFVFEKSFKPWSDQLETGRAINVEIENGDTAKLFLTNVTVNYQDETLSMTFGNRLDRFDAKSIFENVLGGISRSANSINFIKDTMYPIKNGELDRVKKAIEDARNLSMSDALSAEGEEVVIDASGYLGRRAIYDDNGTIKVDSDGNITYDPRQIKITGRNILFTNDGWETCSTAIGEIFTNANQNETAYGVNAQLLIGEAIFGQNLTIRNDNSSVKIDSSGLTINCSNNQTPFKIYKNDSDGTQKELMYIDNNGDLNISGKGTFTDGSFTGTITATKITANKGTIGGVIIKDGYIVTKNDGGFGKSGLWVGTPSSSQNSTKINGFVGKTGWALTIGSYLGVTNGGTLCATGVHVSGEITATSLTLGDDASINYSKISNKPDLTVYISKDGKIGTASFGEGNDGTAFQVSTNGLLQAQNAIIYGTIYASAGKFAGVLDAATGTFKGSVSVGETTISATGSQKSTGILVNNSAITLKNVHIQAGTTLIGSDGIYADSVLTKKYIVTTGTLFGKELSVGKACIFNLTSSSNSSNVFINEDGSMYKVSSSSRRYKSQISSLESDMLNPHGLYKVPIVEYVYKKGYLSKDDLNYGKKVIGLIAEDVEKYYPVGAIYNEDGTVENWNERFIIPGMLKLIQEQHEEIEELKSKVSSLLPQSV